MSPGLLLLVVGAAAALVALWAVLSGPSPNRAGQRRLQAVRLRHSEATRDRVEAQYRKAIAARKPRFHQVAGAGGRLEALALRLRRTGKSWTLAQYLYLSAGLGLAVTLLGFIQTRAGLFSLALGVLLGAGLPHLVVAHTIARRSSDFTTRFPDAIELLVRGLRSGLPVSETLGIIAGEIPGPVGEEFKLVTERIKIGRSMEDALQETADRMETAEFSFFVIALAIQRETGGNLAETLSNLAEVLRKRAQMKLKIRAMSSESKASAYIVGALPFIVFVMIWWINPDYLGAFFTDERLTAIGLGALVWMGLGGFIMARMVSFEI